MSFLGKYVIPVLLACLPAVYFSEQTIKTKQLYKQFYQNYYYHDLAEQCKKMKIIVKIVHKLET